MIVNGRRTNSCLSLALSHAGDKVTTVEGLANGGAMHPLQQAFIEQDAFQCGFCTSGQLCSAMALIDELKEEIPSAVTGEGPQIDRARDGGGHPPECAQ